MTNRLLWPACLLAGAASVPLFAQSTTPPAAADATAKVTGARQFAAPVRLQAEGKPIRTEEPGYAAPCWADVDGDGRKDLLVGQFKDGKIRVHRNLGDGKLADGRWLEAEGKTAEVPGVW